MTHRVVILGANRFIGSALTAAILRARDWEVYGIDLADHKPRSIANGSSTPSRNRMSWSMNRRSFELWMMWRVPSTKGLSGRAI